MTDKSEDRPSPITEAIEAHNKGFTAGNLGIGTVSGLAPYDLVGQRYQNAEDAEEAEDDDTYDN